MRGGRETMNNGQQKCGAIVCLFIRYGILFTNGKWFADVIQSVPQQLCQALITCGDKCHSYVVNNSVISRLSCFDVSLLTLAFTTCLPRNIVNLAMILSD